MNRLTRDVVAFGPFQLFPTARVLEKNGVPLSLGDRALDILILLSERAGDIVGTRELLSRVWRGLVVHPGNLRVQMTNLRKALDDGTARYIANVSGQGYCFVAPTTRSRAVCAMDANVDAGAMEMLTELARKVCFADIAATNDMAEVVLDDAHSVRVLVIRHEALRGETRHELRASATEH